jgi:hypothetical protein
VAFGITAPDASLTTPSMAARSCANKERVKTHVQNKIVANTRSMQKPPYRDETGSSQKRHKSSERGDGSPVLLHGCEGMMNDVKFRCPDVLHNARAATEINVF